MSIQALQVRWEWSRSSALEAWDQTKMVFLRCGVRSKKLDPSPQLAF